VKNQNNKIVLTDGRRAIGNLELIALLAMIMSSTALAIDVMLPAFGDIRAEFGLGSDSTAVAGVVTIFMLGLAVAQVFFGVLADRFGRKPILYAGIAIYIVGAVASTLAPSFGWLLAARFLWGVGSAGPRMITLTILRDTYSGERMAKAMSFVMAIFILVPVVAPSIGAAMTAWISWRAAFGFTAIAAVIIGLWSLRLPESLKPENRIKLTRVDVTGAGRQVLTTRMTLGYMFALTVLFGAFISYIASSELIFSDIYDRGDQFPLIFGGIAVAMGFAALLNGRLVETIGLQRLLSIVMVLYLVFAATLVLLVIGNDGVPPFWLFVGSLTLLTSVFALLIPNINTAAMLPMGRVAGTAAAIIGTVTTGGGALIGTMIDRAYDGTVTPLSVSFLGLGVVAWAFTRWASAGFRSVATEPIPVPAE
jgi:DHA1 family bicyclomycin/chloramphenicol resistance-like MFS transporter